MTSKSLGHKNQRGFEAISTSGIVGVQQEKHLQPLRLSKMAGGGKILTSLLKAVQAGAGQVAAWRGAPYFRQERRCSLLREMNGTTTGASWRPLPVP